MESKRKVKSEVGRSGEKPPDPHEADGFRQFLKEWVAWKKGHSQTFSLRQFALRAGFQSHTFLPKVIDGSRNLADDSIQRVASVLGLSKAEERFFALMVRHDQAEDESERDRLFVELSALRRLRFQRRIGSAQANYYDQWYYPVLRQLAPGLGDDPDPARMGELLVPPVPPAQVRKALADLESMGLLVRDGAKWVAPDSVLSVDSLPRAVKMKGRHDILVRGMESLHRFGPEERSARCLLIGLSEEGHREMLEVLDQAARRCLEIAARDDHPNKIWQIVLQAFPATRTCAKDEGRAPE